MRFIPTCVGNTEPDCDVKLNWPVHPHVCGEHVNFSCGLCGLSRFIPTCVGNTACLR